MTSADSAPTRDLLPLPDAPPIPGFAFRRFRGPDDYPGMVRTNMAARREDGVVEMVTVEGMAVDYAHLTNSDPEQDILIAELDGEIVAYGRTEWADLNEGGRGYISVCLIDPGWRRRGIGRAMLAWQEARRRQVAVDHPGVGPKWLISWVPAAHDGGVALLTGTGYDVVRRYHEMVRPTLDEIVELAVPAGLSIRPGRREDARAVFDGATEAFRDHWGEREEGEEAFQRFLHDPLSPPELWVVAWDGAEVAGSVINRLDAPEDDGSRLGTLDAVSVRRPWRRRGLGRAMVAESLRRLREAGATRATLGVDTQNEQGALALYTSAGFEVANTELEFRRALEPTA